MRWVDGELLDDGVDEPNPEEFEEPDCESPDGVWYGVEECEDSEYNGL